MPEKTKVRKIVYIDENVEDEINVRHAKTKGFTFQSVGEELVLEWLRQGAPYPAQLAMSAPTPRVERALALLDWLENPKSEVEKELGEFVFKVFEKRKHRR